MIEHVTEVSIPFGDNAVNRISVEYIQEADNLFNQISEKYRQFANSHDMVLSGGTDSHETQIFSRQPHINTTFLTDNILKA